MLPGNFGYSDPAEDTSPTDRRCSQWACSGLALPDEDACWVHSPVIYNRTPEYKVIAYDL
jgi:hypothetical protein